MYAEYRSQTLKAELNFLLQAGKAVVLTTLLLDTRRFVLDYRQIISVYPLQIYCSALVFAPEQSLIRKSFKKQYLSFLTVLPTTKTTWDASLQSFHISTPGYGKDQRVVLSHDNRLVAVNPTDAIIVWNILTGTQVLYLPQEVDDMMFTPDDEALVVASHRSGIHKIDIATGASTCLSRPSKLFTFSCDGRWLAVGDEEERKEEERDEEERDEEERDEEERDEEERDEEERDEEERDEEEKVGNNQWGYTIRFYDIELARWSGVSEFRFDDPLFKMELVASAGLQLALLSSTSYYPSAVLAQIWDFGNLEVEPVNITGIIHIPDLLDDLEFYSLAWSPDGKCLAFSKPEGGVDLFDMTKGGESRSLTEGQQNIDSMTWSPDGSLLVIFSFGDFELWNKAKEEHCGSWAHDSRAVAFSSDGRFLVTVPRLDRIVRVLDVGALQENYSRGPGKKGAFSSVITAPSRDRMLIIRDQHNPATLLDSSSDVGTTKDLEFCRFSDVWHTSSSRDGQIVAFGLAHVQADPGLVVWDTTSDTLFINEHLPRKGGLRCLALSPDGARLAYQSHAGTDGLSFNNILIRDVHKAFHDSILCEIQNNSEVQSLAISQDNCLLAVGRFAGRIEIWDAVTGHCVMELLDPAEEIIASILFLSDGDRLASVGLNSQPVLIWDLLNATCVASIDVGTFEGESQRLGLEDATTSSLITSHGEFSFDWSLLDHPDLHSDGCVRYPIQQHARNQGLSISPDGAWILWKNQKLVWLPLDHREDFRVAHWTVAIRTSADIWLVLTFSSTDPILESLSRAAGY
jgi:WD40 repeat protein